jgi:formylglycine-generating enzyme required for sulfatase activity
MLAGAIALLGSQPFAFTADAPVANSVPSNTNNTPAMAIAGETTKETTIDLGGVKMEMLSIPAGEFLMGADKGQPCEKPVHKVTISKPFYMGKYPVTVGQFRAFVDATKHKTQQESWGKQVTWRNPFLPKGTNPPIVFVQGDNYPVVWVAWNDTQEFCKWASKTTKRTVRLSTEAEYEYACRAGTTTRYYSGDTMEDLNRIGWHEYDNIPQTIHWETTHPVGQKEPNQFGLYDMDGNVWQWCQDLFSDTYYAESPAIDPQGPAVGHSEHKGSEKDHVFRGATIGHGEGGSASRRSGKYSSFHLGFRVVVECGPQKAP